MWSFEQIGKYFGFHGIIPCAAGFQTWLAQGSKPHTRLQQ